MPSKPEPDLPIKFDDLSVSERMAASAAMFAAQRQQMGFTPEQAWQLSWTKAWLAARMWMLDHLIAVSEPMPLAVWEQLDLALDDDRMQSGLAGGYTAARRWLDEHRP